MILNGKCADRFKEWVGKNYDILISESYNGSVIEFLYCLPTVCEYALIIEFMDSEGISIVATKGIGVKRDWAYRILIEDEAPIGTNFIFPSRTEALKAAIEKGCEMYNTKNQ